MSGDDEVVGTSRGTCPAGMSDQPGVYLEAFVPADGQSVGDAASGRAAVVGPGASWLVPPQSRDYDDPAEAAWSSARRTPHPAGCFSEPVRLARPLEDYPFTRTYIKASAEPRTNPPGPFWASADRAANSKAWRYREIPTTHMVPANRPDDLARLLLELT